MHLQLCSAVYTVFIDLPIELCSDEVDASVVAESTPLGVD